MAPAQTAAILRTAARPCNREDIRFLLVVVLQREDTAGATWQVDCCLPSALAAAAPIHPYRIGSPGMEVSSGEVASYEVLLVDTDGSSRVFARHGGTPGKK
jgi:hypothetical protein